MKEDKNIYVKTGAENVFIGGRNCWCGQTRQGAKVQVIPRTPQSVAEAEGLARRGLCTLLPARPNEVTRESYDASKPAYGFRPANTGPGKCTGHEADGSACTFEPLPGKSRCFRHETQFQ